MTAARSAALDAAAAAGLLRAAVADGVTEPLADAYAPDAALDVSVPGARTVDRAPAAVRARLAGLWRGAGRLAEWEPRLHPDGVAAWLERTQDDGSAVRQRHYIRLRDGRIAGHWIAAAPPRTLHAPAEELPPPPLYEQIGTVRERSVLAHGGWSGNRVERLVMDDGRVLVAKRIVPGADWLGRATGDAGREGLLHTEGVFERIPSMLDPAIVAAGFDDGAWWVVSRDVTAVLLDGARVLSRAEHRHLVAAAAAMWHAFWDQRLPMLCTAADRLTIASRATAERERDGLDLLPNQFEAAWEAFSVAVDPDVAEAVLTLLEDPRPLTSALDVLGTTLLHGDLRDEHLGFDGDRVVLLDWGIATQGHPAVEFAWHMCHDAWRIAATRDQLVEDLRAGLAERDDPAIPGLLAVAGLLQYGWIFGLCAVIHTDPAERVWAREELAWWTPRARTALATLTP